MQKSNSPGSTSHTVVAVLTLSCPDGRQCVRSLYDGHDLLVGSEPSADLRVTGEGIAAMHCLVRAHQGTVSVRDCYSPSGTFLNDRRVTDAEIVMDSVIRVGQFTVAVALSIHVTSAEPSDRTSSASHDSTRPGTPDARPDRKSTPMNSSDLLRALLSPQLVAPRTAPGSTAVPAGAVSEKTAIRSPAAVPLTVARTATIENPGTAPTVSDAAGPAPAAGKTPPAANPTVAAEAAVTAAVSDARPHDASRTPEGAAPAVSAVPAVPAPRARTSAGAAEDPALRTITSLRSQLEQANAEISALKDCLNASSHQSTVSDDDPWQAEMIELLRAEVVELQTTVAEFHAASSSRGRSDAADQTSDLISRDEAERLVDRLDNLLGELQQRDEQVQLLNDLLEAAENANQAEQDERRQLNRWVSDIEQRIGLREEEWQAERQKLTQSIDRLKAERDRIEAAVSAENARTRNDAVQRMMNGLREEAEAMRHSLSESETRCAQLRRELDEASRKDFREEAVKLAQERAELARMRHELETARQTSEKHVELSESSFRFRALRQHLNEVHDKEKTVRQDTKLGSRISRLWNLLEGK